MKVKSFLVPYTASHRVVSNLLLFLLVQFFSPLIVSKILLECGANGRLNGEADVFFGCHQDAAAAMSRDRQHIGESGGSTGGGGSSCALG